MAQVSLIDQTIDGTVTELLAFAVDLGIAQAAYDKATAFVAGLSNEQKISIIGGESLEGNVTWSTLQLRDGESGVNLQFYVSGFSMVNALTMTWNRDLYAAQFKAVGEEFYACESYREDLLSKL